MYASPLVIMVIESRRIRWVGHIALEEEKNVFLGKPEGKRPLESPRHRGENNITVMWNLKK